MKCGVLVALKISTRNSPFVLPGNENNFASVASRFTYRGPSSTPFLNALPNVLFAGELNTEVSNQKRPGPGAPSTAGVPVTFGRCVLPGALRLAADIEMPIGAPDWALK